MTKVARHGRSIEARFVSQCEIAATWFVIDCKCGWASPLCETAEHAQRYYEAHKRRRAGVSGAPRERAV